MARNLSKPDDGRYKPKHVVFPLLINTIINNIFIFLSVFNQLDAQNLFKYRDKYTEMDGQQNVLYL